MLEKEDLLYILDKIKSAVYVIDENEMILYENQAAYELDGLSKAEVIGRPLQEVYSDNVFSEEFNSPTTKAIREQKYFDDENLEWYSNGYVINALTSTVPLMNKGKRKAVITICDHIPDLKKRIVQNSHFLEKRTFPVSFQSITNGTRYTFEDILGESASIRAAISFAQRFAEKNIPIMLYGETGTGKELFAQSIHNASPAYKGPFVAINCAAIPETLLESTLFGVKKGAYTGAVETEGLFEKAKDGTIFLDEINSLPLQLQAKLLRVLQEKEVQRVGDITVRKINCRVISATNDSPNEMLISRKLREDLFYRLAAGLVVIPPLRERGNDLELLVEKIIERKNRENNMFIIDIAPNLRELMQNYLWPGNVRELINVMDSAFNLASGSEGYLGIEHLPSYIREKMKMEKNQKDMTMPNPVCRDTEGVGRLLVNGDINQMVNQYEKSILEQAMRETAGNLTHCGKMLGISRQALTVKLKKHQLDVKGYKKYSE